MPSFKMSTSRTKLDPKHASLFNWAKEQGCEIKKIAPAYFDGIGVGVVATEDIEPGELLVHVPTHCLINLLTLPTLPDTSPVKHPNTVHGTLAAHVANAVGGHGKDELSQGWAEWIGCLPTWESFKMGLPMFWDEKTFELLPSGTRAYALKQKKQIKNDFERAKSLGLRYTEEQYKWGWSVVNTRTIYYRPDQWGPKVPTADCLCMCPVIDYINHECEKNDDACFVQYATQGDEAGISATSRKPYKKGEQIFVTYGSHSNDALLCEYGFTLDDNQWDSVILDSYVDRLLSPEHKTVMEEFNTLIPNGEYTISQADPSFRLSIAIHLSLISPSDLPTSTAKRKPPNDSAAFKNWKRMLAGEERDIKGAVSAAQVQQRMGEVCKAALKDAESGLETVKGLINGANAKGDEDDLAAYNAIKQRWEQVQRILEGYLKEVN